MTQKASPVRLILVSPQREVIRVPAYNNEASFNVRDLKSLKNVLRFLKLLWDVGPVWAACLAALTVISGLIPVGELWLTGRLVDQFASLLTSQSTDVPREAYAALALLIGLMAMRNWVRLLSEHIEDTLRERVSHRLHRELLEKAYTFELAFFEHEESYDRLQRANRSFGSRLVNIYMDSLSIVQIGITALGFAATLLTGHYLLVVLVLAATLPSMYLKVNRARQTYVFNYDALTPTRRRLAYFRDLLLDRVGAKEVRLFQLGRHLAERWRGYQRQWKEDALREVKRETHAGVMTDMALSLSFGAAAFLLAFVVLVNELTIGYYAMMLRVILEFQTSVERILYRLRDVYQDGLFAHDLFELLDQSPDPPASGSQSFPDPLTEGIRFDDVWFRYPGSDDWVLHGVSFDVKPGEIISLVGRNGSGKSTLAKLLMGMYRPQKGRILFDGIPLDEIDEDELRGHMSGIFQDYAKFAVTLQESIWFGDVSRGADHRRVKQVAEMSGVAAMAADLPNGYDTVLSKEFGGSELSQGQWQKVALARCLMRDADILILDEPTASLDPRAEVAVFDEFRKLASGKTAFLISHRIGTARFAHRILVLQDGRLVGSGHHDALIREGGEYAALFALQAQWYSDAV